jgi:hypothetical protein
MGDFDAARAFLQRPDMFRRFRIPSEAPPLRDQGLASERLLIVFERGLTKRALLLDQMGYHHVAQGELSGEPYVVAF